MANFRQGKSLICLVFFDVSLYNVSIFANGIIRVGKDSGDHEW